MFPAGFQSPNAAAVGSTAFADYVVKTLGAYAYWRLNDPASSTIITDVSGNNLHLSTAPNNRILVSGALAGCVSKAAYLGANKINVGSALGSWPNGGAFSITGWFRQESSASWPALFSIGTAANSPNNVIELRLAGGNDGKPYFSVGNSSGTLVSAACPFALVWYQWHHVVGVYDGTNIYLYVNGELVATTFTSGLVISAVARTNGGINQSQYTADVGNHSLQDIALFFYALNPRQVINLYAISRTG